MKNNCKKENLFAVPASVALLILLTLTALMTLDSLKEPTEVSVNISNRKVVNFDGLELSKTKIEAIADNEAQKSVKEEFILVERTEKEKELPSWLIGVDVSNTKNVVKAFLENANANGGITFFSKELVTYAVNHSRRSKDDEENVLNEWILEVISTESEELRQAFYPKYSRALIDSLKEESTNKTNALNDLQFINNCTEIHCKILHYLFLTNPNEGIAFFNKIEGEFIRHGYVISTVYKEEFEKTYEILLKESTLLSY